MPNTPLPAQGTYLRTFQEQVVSYLRQLSGFFKVLVVDTANNWLGINKTPSAALDLDGNIRLASTTSSSTGVIQKAANRFAHDFTPATSNGGNTFVGVNTGNFTMSPSGGAATLASCNTGIGNSVLYSLTTGFDNTGVGYGALTFNTTGKHQVAVGVTALYNNTTGYDNTAVGWQALVSNTVGYANTAVGYAALQALTGGDGSVTACRNVGVGVQALLAATTGNDNVGIGVHGLFGVTTGTNNVGVGNYTGYTNTTGSGNVYLGHTAGYYETASNSFYVNNIHQADLAGDKAYSLLYGTFSGAAGSLTGQKLTLNGAFKINLASLPAHANNAAAVAGGLAAGDIYRTGGDPDTVCVVH